MNRYVRALRCPGAQMSIKQLVDALQSAVAEAEAESENPLTDPAVLLIAGYVAFALHADISSPEMYRKLTEVCAMRATPVLINSSDCH